MLGRSRPIQVLPAVASLALVWADAPACDQDREHREVAAPAVIPTEILREHFAELRAAVDATTIEYRHRHYRGGGHPPAEVPDDDLLVAESRRFVTLAGDRFRYEHRHVTIDPWTRGTPGDVTVGSWDGFVHRLRGSRAQGPFAQIGENAGFLGQFHQPEAHWLGLARHDGRGQPLAAMLEHPTLHGPFLRHDGRTEWRVQDPELWSHDEARFRHELCSVVAERREDGSPRLSAITRDRVRDHGNGRQAMSLRTTAFSRKVHGPAVPLARRFVQTDLTTWVGDEPSWSRTVIDLIDVRPAAIDEATFAVPFQDGDGVFDGRYQMRYTVGGNLIELPRRREGAILTDRPLRGDVGEDLAEYAAGARIGELHAALPENDMVAVGVEDLDLPAGHAHDLGEFTNMNWGSGVYHDFTVTNGTGRPEVVTEMIKSGPAIFAVQLGETPGEVFNAGRHPEGMSGRGTRLQPGESVRMRVSMSVGQGLWRHAVTLVTDSGERWTYQLSATGVIEPRARTFLRGRPEPGTERYPAAVRLVAAEPEREPLELVGPAGVDLDFEAWITLLPLQFVGGAPMQQVAHFTLDLTRYEGERPVAVELRSANGVETVVLVPETVRDFAGERAAGR